MICLVGTLYGNAQIIGLSLSEFGEMNSDALQVQTGNLLVKMLGQTVYIDRILLVKELYLSQGLIGKAVTHYKAGMTCSAAKVY